MMETLRFLMVTTHYPPYHLGGDAVLVEYLSKELMRMGHDVHVFHNPAAFKLVRKSEPPAYSSDGDFQPTRHEYSANSSSSGPLLALTFDHSSKAKDELRDLAKRISPDVVHWHNTKGFIGRPVSTIGAQSIYTIHDYYIICGRSNLIRPDGGVCQNPRNCQLCHLRSKKPPPIWRLGNRRVIRFPKDFMIISPSDFAAKRFLQDGVRVDTIIRNFVPDIDKSVQANRSESNEIIYLGMLERYKGPGTLIDAFARCKERQGFDLKIIGEGRYKTQLKTMVDSHGLRNRIELSGFMPREQLEGVRQRAAAQVIPSEWFENAPLSALEGLARGTPMIGTEIGGIPEILTPDAGAKTYKPGDADELAERLVEMWEKRDNMDSLGRLARTAYESRYTPRIHLEKYLAAVQRSRRP